MMLTGGRRGGRAREFGVGGFAGGNRMPERHAISPVPAPKLAAFQDGSRARDKV